MEEFEKSYRASLRDVFLYLHRLCADRALAEELTSETFFRALKGLRRFRDECETQVWLSLL